VARASESTASVVRQYPIEVDRIYITRDGETLG
jgi:hypothetical protein